MHWKWWLLAPLVIAPMVYITYEDFGLWPSFGFFALVIPAAFYLYRRDSSGLSAIMKPIAARHGGTLSAATLMNFPSLQFEAAGRHYRVHAMPNAGPNALPGPFTYVQLTLPFDSERQASVRRAPALASSRIRGAFAAMAPDWQATTGDPGFDNIFRLEGHDQGHLAELLDDDLRARLLAARLDRLRLAGDEITVFIDGLAKTSAEIEEMIDLASALADRCENAQMPAK